MTAINLPGQTELPIVVDHKRSGMTAQKNPNPWANAAPQSEPRDVKLAKLLRDYDNRPSSETWSKIQQLSAEILK
jgi:hypothetical protein